MASRSELISEISPACAAVLREVDWSEVKKAQGELKRLLGKAGGMRQDCAAAS